MAQPQQTVQSPDQPREVRPARVRVCYFVHSSSVGGAPLSLLYLLQQLDLDRYEPIVVFPSDSPLRKRYEEHGIATLVAPHMSYFSHTTLEHVSIGNPRSWKQVIMFPPSIVQAYRVVRRLKPAIVHLNSSTLAAQAIGAKLAGARVVWHIREPILDGVIGVRKAFLRWVAHRFTDAIAVILQGDVQRMGSPEKSHVIYNFVDFAAFDRDLKDRSAGGLEKGHKTVVMLGGVSEVKGTLELVKAYPLVKHTLRNVRFIIAGYNGLASLSSKSSAPKRLLRRLLRRGRYARQVHEHSAQHCGQGVVFAGVIGDVPHLLADADLVVFPSTTPHFARPLVEAAAMAMPVVASDLEGPRELVKHGETGLLVPAGDPVALAEAIVTILQDEELARSMGEKGYSMARRLFDASANSQATFAIYEQLLEGTASPAPAQASGATETAMQSGRQENRIGPPWAMLVLAWLILIFGAYFINTLTYGGRWERIQDLLTRVFG